MEFAEKWNEGHYGPRYADGFLLDRRPSELLDIDSVCRKFWRLCLPRLKYWNPAIPMIVNRTKDQAGPATMSIYFRQGSVDATKSSKHQLPSSAEGLSKAPSPEEDEKVVTIDMKSQHSDQILKEFLEKTGAVPVVPTPQEEIEMQEVQERKERGDIDREVMLKYLTQQRREAALMAQARNEAAAMKAAI